MEMCGVENNGQSGWYTPTKYRWYSKYNGARGPWCYNKKEAENGGKEHEKIIRSLFLSESQTIAQLAKR